MMVKWAPALVLVEGNTLSGKNLFRNPCESRLLEFGHGCTDEHGSIINRTVQIAANEASAGNDHSSNMC